MWNVLDHDQPNVSRRPVSVAEPSGRPQFSLAALMEFTTGVCVLLFLLLKMGADVHPLAVGFGVTAITVGTLVALRIVDVLAYREVRDYHGPCETLCRRKDSPPANATRGPSTPGCPSSSGGP